MLSDSNRKSATDPHKHGPVPRPPSLEVWAPIALIVGSVVALSFLFLSPSFGAFPMDDSYIHFVYARNLAGHGLLFFNWPDERGVGTTSILWVLLLAAGLKLGISTLLLAKLLGVASLLTVSLVLFALLRRIWGPLPAFLAAWLVAISGNMLWFALSGMETVLFLAVGFLGLLAYRDKRWSILGVALGLLALIRPEGLALAAAVAAVDVIYRRRLSWGLLRSGLLCILICAPWALYLFLRTGSPVPTSGIGKQLSATVGLDYLVQQAGLPRVLAYSGGLVYPASWALYFLLFTLGGMSLPAPYLTVANIAGNSYHVSIWSIVAWAVAVVLLCNAGSRLAARTRWRAWLQDDAHRVLLVLLFWGLLHNLCYMVFLPVPGTASRYGAINHVLLWMALVAGLLALAPRRRLQRGLMSAVVVIAVGNSLYWNRVYDANLDHMQNVRMQAARFVGQSLPAADLCAAYDVGAVRYYSQRPILDLGGLIDPDAAYVFESGTADRYLLQRGVSCLILPGRTGRTDEGWFDFARIMGLSTSPLIKLHLLKVFEIDRGRWLLGYLPTLNYQASVTVYQMQRISASP